jgi:hypothetical protein
MSPPVTQQRNNVDFNSVWKTIFHSFHFSLFFQQNIYIRKFLMKLNKDVFNVTLIFSVLLSIHLCLQSFSAAACISLVLCNSIEWRSSTLFKVSA